MHTFRFFHYNGTDLQQYSFYIRHISYPNNAYVLIFNYYLVALAIYVLLLKKFESYLKVQFFLFLLYLIRYLIIYMHNLKYLRLD